MRVLRSIVAGILAISQVSMYAQENISPGVTDGDVAAIQSQVTAILGNAFYVADVINVDSSVGNRVVADGAITNPHNLLNACYLFTAKEEHSDMVSFSHGIAGIYKNGTIVWNSGPTINSTVSVASTVSATGDLLDDGKVEIVTSWFEGASGDVERLWIFSWDGSTGRLLNSVDSTNQSCLVSGASEFEYADINGDGVFEVTGTWYENENDEEMQKIIYSWNGVQFGKWANAPQPLPSGFYPRNRVDALVSARVTHLGDTFSYSYSLQNRLVSKQMVNEFMLAASSDSVSNALGRDGWIFGTVPGRGIGWIMLPGYQEFLKPGHSDSSFRFHTNRIPTIITCFIRGENGPRVPMIGDSVEINLDRWFDDVTSNSLKVLSVGPSDPINPFVAVAFLDTVSNHTTKSRSLGWIKSQGTSDKYVNYFISAKSSLQQNNIAAVRTTLGQVLNDVNVDSTSNLTSEAYALIRYNTEYLLSQLPTNPAPGLAVRLLSSSGMALPGGSLQYYEGSWKDAANNNDGSFTVNTSLATVSIRMTYAYGSQTKSNIPVNGGPVTFQTVNTQVKLQNSQGVAIDTGSVQYYAGAWRSFGTTSNGIASMELLPANYSFRMIYAFGINDKQQDIGVNPVVVFQTVNAAVQLKNSQSTLIDQGTVQYYAGAWRDFGATTNGVAIRELLPANYSFRMTYAYASKDKQQNIGTNPTVVFNTVNAAVELRNSLGNLIDQGSVQYYAGAWRSFGTTTHGTATKELLANNYTFRMTYETVSNDKQQDIGTNSTVSFSTVLCTVRVANATGQQVSGAVVSYYSGSWRVIGPTAYGDITKELLPANLTFRISFGGKTQDKMQNLSTNPVVEFVTQ